MKNENLSDYTILVSLVAGNIIAQDSAIPISKAIKVAQQIVHHAELVCNSPRNKKTLVPKGYTLEES